MNRSELREELKKRGLPIFGLKEELVERLHNHEQTRSLTESTPAADVEQKKSPAVAAAAAAEATAGLRVEIEAEARLAAVVGFSGLSVSVACIVWGEGLTAANLASLHVSFAGIFGAARAANIRAKGWRALLAQMLSMGALAIVTSEALRQDWGAGPAPLHPTLASSISAESCDAADERTNALCSSASNASQGGHPEDITPGWAAALGYYYYNDDLLGKVLGVLIDGGWRSSRFSLVQFWGWASVAAYAALVEALPVLLRPLHPYFRVVERLHNVLLSLTSLAMLVGIIRACMTSGKTSSVHDMLCLQFDEADPVFYITSRTFFWSKVWEWLDTALLVAKGKSVSWLHYTHHASTTILTAFNMEPRANAMWSIVCASNSFVHTWMYAYYALPWFTPLRRTRRWLTRAQILQHVAVLTTAIYALYQILAGRECYNSKAPLYTGLGMYFMYLVFFSLFYRRTYNGHGKKNKRKKPKQTAPIY